MKTLLVSGMTGFVGTNLGKYLNHSEYRILSLSRKRIRNHSKDFENFTWNDLDQINQVEVHSFIHLAGKAHDMEERSQEEEYFAANTELTKKLFDFFIQHKAESFIYISSVKAVADKADTVLTENTKPDPHTSYGKSKLRAEEYLLSKALPIDKRLIILRPCMIHGPGNKGNLNLLFKFVRRGFPYPLAAFDNKRSFLSIDNLCFVLKQLIDDPSIPSGVYLIADDEALSTFEVYKTIVKSLNRKPKAIALPKPFIKLLAFLGDSLKMPLNTERLNKLTENYIVSNNKIKTALHIDNLPVTSGEGLKRTFEEFKE